MSASSPEEAVDPLSTSGYRVIVARMVRGARDAVLDSALAAGLDPVVNKLHRSLAQHVDELSDELVHALRWIEYAEAELARREVEVACLRDELTYAYAYGSASASASHTASSRTDMDVDDDDGNDGDYYYDDDDLSSLGDECEDDDGAESALKWMKSQSDCVASQPLDEATVRALEEVLARGAEALAEVGDEALTLGDLDESMEDSCASCEAMEVIESPRREATDENEDVASSTILVAKKAQALSPASPAAIPLVSRIVPPKIFPSRAIAARHPVCTLAHGVTPAPALMAGGARPPASVNVFGWPQPVTTTKVKTDAKIKTITEAKTATKAKTVTKLKGEKGAKRLSGVAHAPAKKQATAVALTTAAKTAKTAKTAPTVKKTTMTAKTAAVSARPTQPTKPTKPTQPVKNKKSSAAKAPTPAPAPRRWR